MRKEKLVKYQQQVLDELNSKTTDKDKPYILMGRNSYSINDCIREVTELTDFGLKTIRSYALLKEELKSKK
jgi:hypothetical protein